MMTTMALEDPVGSQCRHQGDDAHKKDRRACILLRGGPRPVRGWSKSESWALDNGLFLGEVIDSDDLGSLDPAERPGIQKLAELALRGFALPGHVIVDAEVDERTLGVIVTYLDKCDRSLMVRRSPRKAVHAPSKNDCSHWVKAAGAAFSEVQASFLFEMAMVRAAESIKARSVESILVLGEGPRRNPDLARAQAEQRQAAGWSDRRIREYLELYGFTNLSGTVGRWSHDQYRRLMGPRR
jgi:hypothetical protein